MVKSIPYIIVKNAKEAIKMYENVFGAKMVGHEPFTKEVGQQFGFPNNFDYEKSTMHATIDIKGALLYLADDTSGKVADKGRVEIVLDLENKKQIEEIYNKAKDANCEISMELQQTFWGAWYARFTDPMGIGWQLNFAEEQ
jgi:PhnB protein